LVALECLVVVVVAEWFVFVGCGAVVAMDRGAVEDGEVAVGFSALALSAATSRASITAT
jgi:hypothetical protein